MGSRNTGSKSLIMQGREDILDHLKHVFQDHGSHPNGHASFHQFQKKAFDALMKVDFPDKKHEDWKYTSVQRIISPKYNLVAIQPEVDVIPIPEIESYIVSIVNGKVDLKDAFPGLADVGVKIISFREAFEDVSSKESFINSFELSEYSSGRAFELLNFSFNADGFFLDIPPNTILDKPLEIRVVHDAPEVSFSHPLYFIRCGESSKLEIIERFESNQSAFSIAEDSLINTLGYIHIGKNAAVSHVKWQDLPLSQHLIYKLLVTQMRDSRFDTIAIDRGGKLIRNNVEIELEESNTYTSLTGGYFASGKQSMDHQTRINHKVPHCESHELYKGIVDEQASAAFNGKVYVHPDAQKTNAFQQNDTLVLSPHAVMNSKPQLEIFADDVKCSHGATIGQMDEKSLFYLMSRGIKEGAARQMLKDAFLEEVFEKIPSEEVRDFITGQMALGA